MPQLPQHQRDLSTVVRTVIDDVMYDLLHGTRVRLTLKGAVQNQLTWVSSRDQRFPAA